MRPKCRSRRRDNNGHLNDSNADNNADLIALSTFSCGVKLCAENSDDEALTCFRKALSAARCVASICPPTTDNDSSDKIGCTNETVSSSITSSLSRSSIRTPSSCPSSHRIRELYVYQREMYDEGMSAFSAPLPITSALEAKKDDHFLYRIMAYSCYNMGLIYIRKHQYENALILFRAALVEEEALLQRQRQKNTTCSKNGNDIPTQITAILHNIGRTCYLVGNYDAALSAFETALKHELNLGTLKNPLHVASSKACVGILRWCLLEADNDKTEKDRMDEAKMVVIPLLEEALLVKRAVEAEYFSVATILNQLACVYATIDTARAIGALQECLALRCARLDENHPDVLQTLENLADMYQQVGVTDLAMSLYEKCLGGMKATLGSVHRDVSKVLRQIALLHCEQSTGGPAITDSNNDNTIDPNILDLALEASKEALFIGQAALGENHSEVAHAWNVLGYVYECREEFSLAIVAYNKNLRIFEELYGKQHYKIATVLISLGRTYLGRAQQQQQQPSGSSSSGAVDNNYSDNERTDIEIYGDSRNDRGDAVRRDESDIHNEEEQPQDGDDAALQSLSSALDILSGCDNAEGLTIAQALYECGNVLRSKGKLHSAVEAYKGALALRKSNNGNELTNQQKPEQDKTQLLFAYIFHCLGVTQFEMGHVTLALESLSETLRIEQSIHTMPHKDIASTLAAIGSIYAEMGDDETAIVHYEKCLTIQRAVFGNDTPETATSLLRLGKIHFHYGSADVALRCFREMIQIEQRTLGKDSTEVAKSLNMIGSVFLQCRNVPSMMNAFSEASRMFLKCGRDWSDEFNVDDIDFFYMKAALHPDAAPTA